MKYFNLIAVVLVVFAFIVSPSAKAQKTDWEILHETAVRNAIEGGQFTCYKDACVIMLCNDDSHETESGPEFISTMKNSLQSTTIYYTRCYTI